MSIFFDFDVGPRGRRFRKAIDQDKIEIEAMWDAEQTSTLFNVSDIGMLIEKSCLSIVMIDEQMKVTGFLALADHPNVPAVDPAHWEDWIRNMFQKFYLARDTLFIELICCLDSVSKYFLEEALISVFLNDIYLKHIVMVVPPACKVNCVEKYPTYKRRAVFQYCAKTEDRAFCYYLLVAEREDFCPKMKIRRAVEEDNDDIVDILDEQCPRLKQMYGEYYISEILSRNPETKRKIVVAEVPDRITGVMCLNADVNYALLQSTYELSPYNGLVRASPEHKEEVKRTNELLRTFGEPIMLGQLGPFDRICNLETSQQVMDDVDEASAMKINMSAEDRQEVERPRKIVRHSMEPTMYNLRPSDDFSQDYSLSLINTDASITALLGDDDAFEYDIVNIDAGLMQSLEVPSCMDLQAYHRLSTNDIRTRPRYSVRRRSSAKKRSYQFQTNELQTYLGEPNAFLIELLGLRDDVDVRKAFDLLEAAFECMPQFEYCVIRVPCADKSLFLLQHFSFVPTKPNVCCKYALYLAHRNSVLGKIRVRKAEFGDIPQIASLLHNLDAKETLWTVEHSMSHPRQHLAYIFLCGSAIIGLGILEPPEDIQLIREEFSIEQYHIHKYHIRGQGVSSGFASLKTALVYPVFQPHFRFFARDMLRQSSSSSIVWLTSYRNKMVTFKANAMVGSMIPLMPRKGGMEFYGIFKQVLSFNAWLMNSKMTSVPKLNVDSRIVIVGGSRTAMGFLNTLLFEESSAYLTFTNVTLVSPHGLPYSRHISKSAEMMFPVFKTSRNEYIKCTPYTFYVNVIHGSLTEINKQDKYITIDTIKRVHYDHLILLFGEQYQHPDYLKALKAKNLPEQGYVRLDVPRQLSDTDIDPSSLECDTPENVFIINTTAEASRSLNYVKNILARDTNMHDSILVYGASIHTYCTISALLDIGVSPASIIFAEPFPPEDETETRVPVFCNVNVDKSVSEIIKALKIKTYRGFYFQSWKCVDGRFVSSVDLLSHYEYVTVDCCALFYYGKKDINVQAFVAVIKSGLAFDGGVLIDHQFKTNNSSIYAAGPATRYQRRYFADHRRHLYYDSYEVGTKLGEQIRNQLDPLFTHSTETKRRVQFDKDGTSMASRNKSEDAPEPKWALPELKHPIVWCCTLPGELNYLEVRTPGKKYPNHYIQSLQFNGLVMETFKHGYFKLHFTKSYVVDGITCLTPEKYALENFKYLYGLSGVVLNNVHLRYNSQKIDDFYEFFTAPWAAFLYHERAPELLAMIKELQPKNEPSGKTIQEVLRNIALAQTDKLSDFSKILRTQANFEKSSYFAAIADYVLEWLSENVLLPMYLQPWQVAEYSLDLDRHPAFKRRKRTFKKMLKEIRRDLRLMCR